GGSAWTTVPTVSSTAGLLLSGSDLIRFVPRKNFVGPVSVTAMAWDGSAGTHGTTVNPSKTSSTAFSASTLIATLSVNTAPTLGAATGPTLPAITEGVAGTIAASTLLKD